MNLDQDRSSFTGHVDVSRETLARIDQYVEIVLAENQVQNLIARSTETEIWTRHILDSAQLLPLAPAWARTCLDVGSGGGGVTTESEEEVGREVLHFDMVVEGLLLGRNRSAIDLT